MSEHNEAPSVQLPPVEPGGTVKQVGRQCLSEHDARRFQVPRLSWAVRLVDRATCRAGVGRLVAAFEDERAAYAHAEAMPEAWNVVWPDFRVRHPNPYRLAGMAEELCRWLQDNTCRAPVGKEGLDFSMLPNGNLAADSKCASLIIAEAFGGRVAYCPRVTTGGKVADRAVALVGVDNRFLVDWKSVAFGDGEKFLFDRRDPRDAEKVLTLYGAEYLWTYPPLHPSVVSVYHARVPSGQAPSSFEPERYIKVAEVLTDSLVQAVELTSNRPCRGEIERLQDQIFPWYFPVHDDARVKVISTLPLPAATGSRGESYARKNDVVETNGVPSEGRQTWPDDVLVTPCGQAYTAFGRQPISRASLVALKECRDVERAQALLAADGPGDAKLSLGF